MPQKRYGYSERMEVLRLQFNSPLKLTRPGRQVLINSAGFVTPTFAGRDGRRHRVNPHRKPPRSFSLHKPHPRCDQGESYNHWIAHGQSKSAIVLFATLIGTEWRGIEAFSLCPGGWS